MKSSMNNGQRNENCEHHRSFIRFISIVPINVYQFIDDSEIYDTIIMMHLVGMDAGRRRDTFTTQHLQEWHVGASATFSILLFYDSPLFDHC